MRYIMMNKPAGYISARRDRNYPVVMDLVPDNEGLHIAGRLDRDAEGLLILTDDGDFTFRITRPEFGIRKKYYFKAFGSLSEEDVRKAAEGGIPLGDGSPSLPADIKIEKVGTVLENIQSIPEGDREHCLKNPGGPVTEGTITVSEGKFHEVKLILYRLRCKVFRLKRLSQGDIELDERLGPGQFREFTPHEMEYCARIRSIYIENV